MLPKAMRGSLLFQDRVLIFSWSICGVLQGIGQASIIVIENDLLFIIVLVHIFPLLFHSSYLRLSFRRT